MLVQQWWVWLGRPRWIQITTKFTIIKHNVPSLRGVKQHQHFNTAGNKAPKPSAAWFISARRAPGNGLPSLERRRLTDRPDSATRQVLRPEPTRSEANKPSEVTHLGSNSTAPHGSHRCYGTSLDMLEQKMSMVPYQEVRSTSQTLWEPRRMFSQVAMRRPPEPPDLSGGRDPAATAAAASNHNHPQWAGIGIIRMTIICSRSSFLQIEQNYLQTNKLFSVYASVFCFFLLISVMCCRV